jgi:hypothetical protein
MPSFANLIISATVSLVFGPILLAVCLVLFPFAVLTTYFAFIALTLRAALVYLRLLAALLQNRVGLDDSASSAWAPSQKSKELESYHERSHTRRKSLINYYPARSTAMINGDSAASPASLACTIVPAEPSNKSLSSSPTKSRRSASSSNSNAGSPTRTPSSHSSLRTRDYEGIGGWRPISGNAPSGPEPESASLEWLVTNARLELPEADASSLTRPRTPEDSRTRSPSIGQRSFDTHGRHERSATVGSIGFATLRKDSHSDTRPKSLLERSASGFLKTDSESEELLVSGRQFGEVRPKSMIFLGERGSHLAYRLAGLKAVAFQRKFSGQPEGSRSESDGEEPGQDQDNETNRGNKGRRRSISGSSMENKTTRRATSVEGGEVSGLSMWMQ